MSCWAKCESLIYAPELMPRPVVHSPGLKVCVSYFSVGSDHGLAYVTRGSCSQPGVLLKELLGSGRQVPFFSFLFS